MSNNLKKNFKIDMNNILYFKLNDNKYLFYQKENKIKLGRVVDNNTCSVDENDSKTLKEIVNTLCLKDVKNLKKIKVLKNKKVNVIPNKNITLVFTGNKKENFINNCAFLKKKSYIPKKIIFLMLITIALTSLISYSVVDKEIFLKKYTINNKKNINVKVVNIEDVGKKKIEELESNLDILTWNIKYNEEFETFYSNSLYNVNLNLNAKKIFEDNKIDNKFDLTYYCLLNYDKKVSISSSKEDILEKYVFDSYASYYVPYDKNSKINRFIVFTGQKIGFAYINDNDILIELENDDKIFRIDFSNSNVSDEKIINLVSQIK